MSLLEVRNLFREELIGLDFVEHKDSFAFNNIPRSGIDRAFHIDLNSVSQDSRSYPAVFLTALVTIRLFRRGYLDAVKALTDSYEFADDVIANCLEISFADQHPIKGVSLRSCTFEPLNGSDDNSILTTISFSVGFSLCVDGS